MSLKSLKIVGRSLIKILHSSRDLVNKKTLIFQARNHLLSKKSSWLNKVCIPNEKNKDSSSWIYNGCVIGFSPFFFVKLWLLFTLNGKYLNWIALLSSRQKQKPYWKSPIFNFSMVGPVNWANMAILLNFLSSYLKFKKSLNINDK